MPAKCQHLRVGDRLALPLILAVGRIEVTRRTLATSFPQVTMTSPDGSTRTITLNQPRLALGVIDVDKSGLYHFDDGTLHTVAAVGNPDPLEFSDVCATDQKLKPLVEASGGTTMWLTDNPDPELRSVRPGRVTGWRLDSPNSCGKVHAFNLGRKRWRTQRYILARTRPNRWLTSCSSTLLP
jgi:hypothetical protein